MQPQNEIKIAKNIGEMTLNFGEGFGIYVFSLKYIGMIDVHNCR